MSVLGTLSRLLGVRTDEVEAVLRHDAARARETVTRRRFMGAAAALASAPFVPQTWLEWSLREVYEAPRILWLGKVAINQITIGFGDNEWCRALVE